MKSKQWRLGNAEKNTSLHTSYYSEHRERLLEYCREYFKIHHERICQYYKEYHRKRREQRCAHFRENNRIRREQKKALKEEKRLEQKGAE